MAWRCGMPRWCAAMCWVFVFAPLSAFGQSANVDTGSPPGLPDAIGSKLGGVPGDPNSGNKLGAVAGMPGTSAFDVLGQGSPISGRPGPTVSRALVGNLSMRGGSAGGNFLAVPKFETPDLRPAQVPNFGPLEDTGKPEDIGPADGLTLDAAIDRYIRRNLEIEALRYEIPMAQADVLTASLRVNPIFYADAQLVPYGHYSNNRPGGQTQYDVNVTIPLDVTRKRIARTIVAQRTKSAIEAQFIDAIRLRIDNLYTAYIDVVAARQGLILSTQSRKSLAELVSRQKRVEEAGDVPLPIVQSLAAQLDQLDMQIAETTTQLERAKRALGNLLVMSPAEIRRFDTRASLERFPELPKPPDDLARLALENRPDLLATRRGVALADAGIHSAKAQRYTDVYLLLQPYTFQNNSPFGLKSATSYAVGVTANLPLFNRNQGNIDRAVKNAKQTRIELTAIERQVVYDVQDAISEFKASRLTVDKYKNNILPTQAQILASAKRRLAGSEVDFIFYLTARKDYFDVFRQYRDALVRHRRAQLNLNTAVGVRIFP